MMEQTKYRERETYILISDSLFIFQRKERK